MEKKLTNKKILIIQTAFIGDVILTLPLVQTLKLNFPECTIDFMCIPYTEKVLSANPNINEIIIYNKKDFIVDRPFRLLYIAWKISKKKYDLAFIPHRSFRTALIIFLSRISRRIGFDIGIISALYTNKVRINKSFHEVEKNISLLEIIAQVKSEKIPRLYPSEKDLKIFENSFSSIGNNSYKGIIALAPGSKWNTKRWPVEYFISLAKMIISMNYLVVLIGGNEDLIITKKIIGEIKLNIMDFCGKLEIIQSYLLLKKCELLISNDSAAVHLASAANIPVFDIYGPTIPSFGFAPLSEGSIIIEKTGLECRPCGMHGHKKCPIGTLECMKSITPDFVFEKIINYLENK